MQLRIYASSRDIRIGRQVPHGINKILIRVYGQ
jgi:hypothetical protein